MPRLVGVVDGGGSKTQAAWADLAGRVWLAPAEAGCNPQDNPQWRENLGAAIGHLPLGVEQVTLGLAGLGEVPDHDAAMTHLASELLPHRATAMNDVAMAYRGAFPDGGGVLILAGTGSMAMALGPNGLVRSGGWGDAFGDEGSGWWIGRAALSLAAKMIDGRVPDSGFAGALAAALGLPANGGDFALLNWVMAQYHQRSAIASVAQHVDHLAGQGDATATGLLHSAADELHQHMIAASRLSGLGKQAHWACAGSVFNSTTLSTALTALVGKRPVKPQLDALGGGLWLAAQAAEWPVGPDWITTIAAATSKGTPE